jgi:hypothetical protein
MTAFGPRAFKGGAVIAAITIEAGAPHSLSATVATSAKGDRLPLEPDAIAAALPRGRA